ncbi:uncharacterized protein LTR77_004859 [Saxophila tyrrhenica]|uniref:Annexin n=1 Tax=Saxophila tyrrhenica TaxID=1690608 RepID=A0AAV9PDQ6_9PEZI|nr:hypothetical protein LTR77_004859 [Saxophila tyrrhenica]
MSYYPPPGPPPQGSHSPYPQGGYQQPQQQPYGQQAYGQQPPPMNQGYYGQPPPMQQGYNQPPGPPPGHSPYPQMQQGYNQQPGPPPSHSPYPPMQQGYNQPPGPPPSHSPYPPMQQGYGAPPGPPPGQQAYGAPGYGAGPPAGPPAQPSIGYVPGQQANMDMSRAADDLRSAMKGFGTNEQALIKVLAGLDPLQVNSVKAAFQSRHHRDLMKDVHGETSGYFREGLEAIIRGPLDQDCHVLHESIKGAGTKESAMNDALLSRSNADVNAIKARYQQMYRRSLESDVRGDLSMKTERLFDMVMAARRAEESTPVMPQQVDADVQELYRATEGKTGTDQIAVCQIMAHRSNGQLRAISQAYKHKYHRGLDDVIRREFSGHMEQALIYMLRKAEDPAKHDADLLEDSMRGAGTKDQALVRRIVMIHWSRDRKEQCKAAYQHFHKRDLRSRIQGETSGDYEKLMVACIS